jgi:DNA repair protein RadD
VSCDILTVGFDAPLVDALILLRPTQSTGLYVQICGRGMRLSPGKTDCLVLDYGDNVNRHGPITAVSPKEAREQPAPGIKDCPACSAELKSYLRTCPECGFVFPRQERAIEHDTKAARAAVMGPPPAPEWIEVVDVSYSVHVKEGKPPTMRARYMTGNLARKDFSEWLAFAHGGFAADKAIRWWAKKGGLLPAPRDAQEAVDRSHEVRRTTAIVVEADGKYWRIKDAKLGERPVAVPMASEPGSDDAGGGGDFDAWATPVGEPGWDDIPF